MKTPSKISSVVLWSVISAAFIGPGTITTAVTAGSQFQIQLLWTIVFATLACIVLQEVSARIIIASGVTFGQALSKRFGARQGSGIKWIVAVPVLLGCAAYEAGNILGAVSGLGLLIVGNQRIYTIIITVLVAFILWKGGSRTISLVMTTLVAMMGVAFFILSLQSEFSFFDLLKSSVTMKIPPKAEWLALALVGTTIVPYNIFIGSAISKGHTIPLMRIGLTVSVILGGMITAWIMVAGTLTGDFSSFAELATNLTIKLGAMGVFALGIGLFAAGFSSAITSPYAASLIASTVLGAERKSSIKAVWISVLLVGFAFGISGVKPIPVILAVQALNGFVLPLLTYFLILLINDKQLIGKAYRHAVWYDGVLIAIFGITLLIGLNNVDKAIVNGFALQHDHFVGVVMLTILAMAILIIQLIQTKKITGVEQTSD
jgi:manganese transport protein